MADDQSKDEPKPKSGMMMNLIMCSVVGLVCGGLGFGFATLLPAATTAETSEKNEVVPPSFVEFGEVVANINEGRMSRYLRVNVTLQVKGEDQEKATAALESHKAILRNWLLGYMSDLQLDDISGLTGQNRIRRDAQNHFNDVLSPDGTDLIQDILFQEFTIQ